MRDERLNILTWHVHGTYLNNLCQVPHNWYLPVKPGRPAGYGGRGATFDWPDYVREVPAEEVKNLRLDLVLYQSVANYTEDQYEILSPAQRELPRIYLEHNVPRPHAVATQHPVDDPGALLVHVTHYNRLMWDAGRTPTAIIEHGVRVPEGARYTGELERGVVVVNGMQNRPRITGHDLVLHLRGRVPFDLIGMQTEELGGLGDIPHRELHAIEAHYRFFWHPIRYTSLALAMLEAMMLGMPVLCFAVTEHPRVIQDGVTGFISCSVEELVERMRALLRDPGLAAEVGRRGRQVAEERYNMRRFVRDWDAVLRSVAGTPHAVFTVAPGAAPDTLISLAGDQYPPSGQYSIPQAPRSTGDSSVCRAGAPLPFPRRGGIGPQDRGLPGKETANEPCRRAEVNPVPPRRGNGRGGHPPAWADVWLGSCQSPSCQVSPLQAPEVAG